MGDDASPVAMPASAVTVNRKSGAQLALALTVFALVLASNSIINESWLTATQEVGDVSFTGDYSLTEITAENTATGDIESESYESLYDDCKDLEGEEIEAICADRKDRHDAGYVAIIMLIVSSILLLVATVMQVRSMIGMEQRIPNLISAIGGIFVGLSVLVWWLIFPESEIELEWGQGLWMALVAAGAGLIAGFSGTIQSWIDGPPRMRAQGVRSGTDMNEFVLKESSCGDHTLSILADSDLIRVVRVERVGASPSIKDVLATRRDSYTGFSHQRLDWLDDFKGLWWVLAGASLISSFMISALFLIPFTIAALLALLQLMDPERFVVSTNSGDHPFYINRWRSNRELTDLAMDLVDEAMISVLRGNDLDTSTLDARADLIAERFSAEREAKQEAEQAAAAEKEAFIAAASAAKLAAKAAQEVEAQTPPPSENPPPSVTPLGPPSTVAQTPAPPAQIPPPPGQIPAPQDVEEALEPVPEPAVGAVEEAPAEEPEEPEESVSEPVPEPEVVEEAVPETPAPAPAVTIPPPPPLPAVAAPPPAVLPPPPSVLPPPPAALPPPPAAIPPPPAIMPPPPGLGGMALPPPPAGAAILPPMANPQPVSPPPPVLVQAAPREENLSDDEKDNLLGDLSS